MDQIPGQKPSAKLWVAGVILAAFIAGVAAGLISTLILAFASSPWPMIVVIGPVAWLTAHLTREFLLYVILVSAGSGVYYALWAYVVVKKEYGAMFLLLLLHVGSVWFHSLFV